MAGCRARDAMARASPAAPGTAAAAPYMYKGLPPGPINSPGLQSLLAALNPQINNYFYFVAKGDGYHTFSKNEKEHERAKRAFQRVRKKVKRQRTGL